MKRLSALTSDLTFIGFVAIDTPAFESIPSSLAYLRDKKIPFCLFTDGSGEDINFARKLGVIRGRDDLVDGRNSDDAVNMIFSEKSTGGAVYCTDDSVIGSFLHCAKTAGKKIIHIGDGHNKEAGFSVVFDRPESGTGAFIKSGKNLGDLTVAFVTLMKISAKLNHAYLYLSVSSAVRAIYAVSLIFGFAYVYPSVILCWGLVFDSIVSMLIMSMRRREK